METVCARRHRQSRHLTRLLPLALSLVACREPTQITLELTTDVACSAINATSITVGTLGEIENKPEAAKTSACQDGRIGHWCWCPPPRVSARLPCAWSPA